MPPDATRVDFTMAYILITTLFTNFFNAYANERGGTQWITDYYASSFCKI